MDEGMSEPPTDLFAASRAVSSASVRGVVFLRDPGFDVMDALDAICDDCTETNEGMDYWGELDPGALWRVEVKLS